MCNHPITTRLPGYQFGEGNKLIILANCDICHTTLVIGEQQNGEDTYFDERQGGINESTRE